MHMSKSAASRRFLNLPQDAQFSIHHVSSNQGSYLAGSINLSRMFQNPMPCKHRLHILQPASKGNRFTIVSKLIGFFTIKVNPFSVIQYQGSRNDFIKRFATGIQAITNFFITLSFQKIFSWRCVCEYVIAIVGLRTEAIQSFNLNTANREVFQ